MTEADIDGAIDTIQQAFANDPYNNWVYPDRSKVRNPLPASTASGKHFAWIACLDGNNALPTSNTTINDHSKATKHPSAESTTSSITIPYRLPLTPPPGLPSPQPRLPHPPLPLGNIPRPLPRRPQHLEPHQDPRLRNVAPSISTLTTTNLVPLPLLLVALVLPNPYEPVVRPRRALHKTLLDMEVPTSRSTIRAMDEREGILFLQYCDGVAGGAGTGCGEGVDGGGAEGGG